jgi:subtilisin family serine protease
MREYNVALKEGVDYDGFWNDIESDTDGGKLYIPNRAVQFTNERPASLRQCWYLLTDEEAETLRNDDRVFCVEIPPEHRDDIIMMPTITQTGDFTKTTSDSGAFLNWGLIRSSNATNVYGTGTTTALNYEYTLDGTGVDVVIQDSGLQVDHPEFQDGSGNSRVQQIDWATVSGLAFTQNVNHYRDLDGHGTHCAGIACGKTYGWAKNARVYSQKLDGLEGSGDSGTGISITYAFDAIKIWHTSKAGARPTVVNMSWGYGRPYNTVTSLTYRGTSYTDSNTTSNASYRYTNYGLNSSSGSPTATYIANLRIGSVDTDIEELIAAGVIVCIAAGNRGTKIDVSGGTDYNNFVVTDQGTIYYHRGSSPYSDNALMVGSMDSTVFDATNDQRATYSETGPGVNIWAPGTNIMSATSTTNKWGGGSQNYYLNASYRQTNISGTSMATPQVAGVAALVLQLNPSYTPAQTKTSLINTAGTAIYTTGLTNDYSNTRSLLGSSQKVLYSNYNLATTTTTTTAPTTTTTTTAPTTTTTTAAPTTTTTTAAPTTTTTTAAPGPTTTTTTTTTTTEAPPCIEYRCLSSRGGYIFWTDCATGLQSATSINGGKVKFITSITYPIPEKGSNTKITRITT